MSLRNSVTNGVASKGALGSWGASMIEPYSDKPETSGIMRSSPEALSRLVKQFWQEGWQVVSFMCTLFCLSSKLMTTLEHPLYRR